MTLWLLLFTSSKRAQPGSGEHVLSEQKQHFTAASVSRTAIALLFPVTARLWQGRWSLPLKLSGFVRPKIRFQSLTQSCIDPSVSSSGSREWGESK